MTENSALRVLVIDNDPRAREQLVEILALKHMQAQAAVDKGDALIAHAHALARVFRPHVAIVDMRLYDDDYTEDISGIKLAQELSRWTRCVVYSAFLTSELTRVMNESGGTIIWVGKDEKLSELVKAVQRMGEQLHPPAQPDDLHLPPGWSEAALQASLLAAENTLPDDLPGGMLDDLLRRQFPGCPSLELHWAGATPAAGLPLHSLTLLAQRSDRVAERVVKIAPSQRLLQEYQRYHEHIEGNLNGAFHAQMEGEPTTFWDLAAAQYNFMSESIHPLPTLAQAYPTLTAAEIGAALEMFFAQVWGGLYARRQPLQAESLFAAYDAALGLASRLTQTTLPVLPDGYAQFPHPLTWLRDCQQLSRMVRDPQQAITHGDLHSGNLFIAPPHAWAIDFDRSGPGPALRDLTELAADLLVCRLPAQVPLAGFFALAQAAAAPRTPQAAAVWSGPANQEIEKALAIHNTLRRLAVELTDYRDGREFIWGMLADAVFIATQHHISTEQRQRALLLGACLCQQLEQTL